MCCVWKQRDQSRCHDFRADWKADRQYFQISTFYEMNIGVWPRFDKYNSSQPVNGGLPQVLHHWRYSLAVWSVSECWRVSIVWTPSVEQKNLFFKYFSAWKWRPRGLPQAKWLYFHFRLFRRFLPFELWLLHAYNLVSFHRWLMLDCEQRMAVLTANVCRTKNK